MIHHEIISSEYKKNIIFIHGFLGHSKNLFSLYNPLKNTYNTHSIDLPHHGKSSWDNHFTITNLSQSLKNFIESEFSSAVNIVAHSLGGKVAMKMTLDYPHLIDKLVILDIDARDISDLEESNNIRNIIFTLNLINLNQSKADIIKDLEKNIEKNIALWLSSSLVEISENQYKWSFNLEEFTQNLDEIFKPITGTPSSKEVLFLKAENSSYINNVDFTYTKNLFPNSQVIEIQNTSHWLHTQDPKTILEYIKKTLTYDKS